MTKSTERRSLFQFLFSRDLGISMSLLVTAGWLGWAVSSLLLGPTIDLMALFVVCLAAALLAGGALFAGVGLLWSHTRGESDQRFVQPVAPGEDPVNVEGKSEEAQELYEVALASGDRDQLRSAASLVIEEAAVDKHIEAVEHYRVGCVYLVQRQFLEAREELSKVREAFLPPHMREVFRHRRVAVCRALDAIERIPPAAHARCAYFGNTVRDFFRLLVCTLEEPDGPDIVSDVVSEIYAPSGSELVLQGQAYERIGLVDHAITAYRSTVGCDDPTAEETAAKRLAALRGDIHRVAPFHPVWPAEVLDGIRPPVESEAARYRVFESVAPPYDAPAGPFEQELAHEASEEETEPEARA